MILTYTYDQALSKTCVILRKRSRRYADCLTILIEDWPPAKKIILDACEELSNLIDDVSDLFEAIVDILISGLIQYDKTITTDALPPEDGRLCFMDSDRLNMFLTSFIAAFEDKVGSYQGCVDVDALVKPEIQSYLKRNAAYE